MNLREDIPTPEKYASILREDIPTSEKRDPVWREDIQTSENCVLDLRHIIPTWGWSAPDSGQAIPTQGRLVHNLAHIILTHRCYFPLLEHTGLDGDRADDGADDGDKHLEHLLHC